MTENAATLHSCYFLPLQLKNKLCICGLTQELSQLFQSGWKYN